MNLTCVVLQWVVSSQLNWNFKYFSWVLPYIELGKLVCRHSSNGWYLWTKIKGNIWVWKAFPKTSLCLNLYHGFYLFIVDPGNKILSMMPTLALLARVFSNQFGLFLCELKGEYLAFNNEKCDLLRLGAFYPASIFTYFDLERNTLIVLDHSCARVTFWYFAAQG